MWVKYSRIDFEQERELKGNRKSYLKRSEGGAKEEYKERVHDRFIYQQWLTFQEPNLRKYRGWSKEMSWDFQDW